MDALARLLPTAITVLEQVDDVLAKYGAPPEHEVWALLRRVGRLPADAVTTVAGLSVEPWREEAASVRRMRDGTRAVLHRLATLTSWDGPAGHAFDAKLAGLRARLESVSRRQEHTAAYMDEVGAWCEQGRAAMAHALARAISSAEAVILVTGGLGGRPPRDRALAAAEIAVTVLETFERSRIAAEAIASSWGRQLTEVFDVPVTGTDEPPVSTVRVEL